MSENTKVVLYTILLLLALFLASFVSANKEACESNGSVYTRQSMSWSYECIIPNSAEIKP